jgi:GSH-dependent disulfide-bond oxidoreductase
VRARAIIPVLERNSPMIDFYALTSPNVQKIFIMLEECGLPYSEHHVDVWKGDQFTPEFTKINPLQKVPAIVDSEGPASTPYTVIESGAILIYLAEKTGKFIPHDPLKRNDVMQWLMVQMANVGPMFGQHVHFSKFAPAGNDYGVTRYRTIVNKLFDIYDQRFASEPFVAGGEYTIADMAAFPWLRNTDFLGIDIAKRPHVKAWVDKITAREGVKRAYTKIAQIKSVRDNATDNAKDRLWGRGEYAVA